MARQKTSDGKFLRLRQLRRSRDMTQAELGQRVQLKASTIHAIEWGLSRPSFDKGLEIAAVFGLPVEEVFSYVEVPA